MYRETLDVLITDSDEVAIEIVNDRIHHNGRIDIHISRYTLKTDEVRELIEMLNIAIDEIEQD